MDSVDYEDIFYRNLGENTENVSYSNPQIEKTGDVSYPFN